MRVLSAVALLALVLLAAACGPAPDPSAPPRVIDVVDGDTVVVRVAGRDETVRLIGIDTPETKHPGKPVECFGPEASDFTSAVLPDGTEVRLERDEELRDHFGRLLAYLYRARDGAFVNLELARRGYARTLSIAPNDAHAAAFEAAAREARQQGRGLWQTCEDP